MYMGRKVAAAAVIVLVALFVAAALAGCGGSSPAASTTTAAATTSTTAAGATTTTAVAPTTTLAATDSTTTSSAAGETTSTAPAYSAADKQAAEAYFVTMAPVIDKDYAMLQWFTPQLSEWSRLYASTDLTSNKKAWNALRSILEQALAKEKVIIKGYEAITPSAAFQKAHATLLENNRQGNAWAGAFIAAIKAGRPGSELLAMLEAGPPGPSNTDVLTQFQAAASAVGIELPSKFVEAYTESINASGPVA